MLVQEDSGETCKTKYLSSYVILIKSQHKYCHLLCCYVCDPLAPFEKTHDI